jgi:hypothetical protein
MEETKRDLAADLALCERATAGPWRFEFNDDDSDMGAFMSGDTSICEFGSYPDQYDQTAGNPPTETDRFFIAEARTGWPHAIERALAAEAEVQRLRRELERVRFPQNGGDFW